MAIAGTLPLLLLLLLLPLSSLSPAVAARIPTLPACAQDPEFQCQDIETAIRCGALGHCLRKVWGRANADDLCQECQGILTILTKMAKETLFKKTIQHFLEEECSKLPVKLMVPNCQHIVDEYLSLLITHFQGQIPKRICGSLGLCEDKVPLSAWEPESQDLSEKLVPAFLEDFPGRLGAHTQDLMEQRFPIPLPFCWICRTLLKKVQSMIPKSVLAVAVAQVCHIVPLVAGGICQCLAERYTVILVDALMSRVLPQLVCGLILRCSTEEGSNLGLLPNQWTPSDPDCHLCISVTSWASSQLPANSTERDVEKTLVGTCNNPKLDWQECQGLVEQFYPALLSLLPHGRDPHNICQALGVCEMELSQPRTPACAQGPSFWCSSIQAAKECHAVLYCKIHGQD
ncbi:pulmonary surfactant-associated protein B isoform X2 [Phascolarctos cinereus]|uniref:Pulmonary surfactant-associated protein B n=1 Tax=Phascolarctos cinereus TaxID=38626 RepID=A0A6P5ISY9_PHACI|nr:pulmonary surfactant-associated protein B isoform X2 [Phascolarctos cinereus]